MTLTLYIFYPNLQGTVQTWVENIPLLHKNLANTTARNSISFVIDIRQLDDYTFILISFINKVVCEVHNT